MIKFDPTDESQSGTVIQGGKLVKTFTGESAEKDMDVFASEQQLEPGQTFYGNQLETGDWELYLVG